MFMPTLSLQAFINRRTVLCPRRKSKFHCSKKVQFLASYKGCKKFPFSKKIYMIQVFTYRISFTVEFCVIRKLHSAPVCTFWFQLQEITQQLCNLWGPKWKKSMQYCIIHSTLAYIIFQQWKLCESHNVQLSIHSWERLVSVSASSISFWIKNGGQGSFSCLTRLYVFRLQHFFLLLSVDGKG